MTPDERATVVEMLLGLQTQINALVRMLSAQSAPPEPERPKLTYLGMNEHEQG